MAANIDWDNAPGGATHYCTEPMTYPFHKLEGDKWYFHTDQLGWVTYQSQQSAADGLKMLGLTEMPKTEGTTLDRHDAMQWCLNNLREFTALGIIGRGYPEGWTFTSDNGELLLCHTFHDPIKKVDFDMMPKPKAYAGDTPWMPEAAEECEAVDYSCGNEEYYQKVIFIGDNPCGSFKAFSCVDGGDLFWSDKFRPLRTQEEIEREEGIKALTELVSECLSGYNSPENFEAMIWDAGWRKA